MLFSIFDSFSFFHFRHFRRSPYVDLFLSFCLSVCLLLVCFCVHLSFCLDYSIFCLSVFLCFLVFIVYLWNPIKLQHISNIISLHLLPKICFTSLQVPLYKLHYKRSDLQVLLYICQFRRAPLQIQSFKDHLNIKDNQGKDNKRNSPRECQC